MTVVVAASMVLVAVMAVRSRATQPAQAASATASSASAANGAVGPASAAPESLLTRYAIRTDSLEEAIAFYREAQGEFEQKLIGCPTLARAYDMSNQRFWVMSKARGDVEEMLDPAAVMNANMLSAEMEDITRDFVRSRCRR